MGYDVSIARAFDPDKLGWRYDALSCGDGTIPFLDCSPITGDTPILQEILSQPYGNVILTWNLGQLPVFLQATRQQVGNRKIYNTHLSSQGNEGHDFTTVLTDQEPRALIEYLQAL